MNRNSLNSSHPYNWWFSGALWYCHVRLRGTQKLVRVSGAGKTKSEAANDAKETLRRKAERLVL